MRFGLILYVVFALLVSKPYIATDQKRHKPDESVGALLQRTDRSNMNLGSQSQDEPDNNTWGGNGIRITLTPGGGNVEFDCAHGEISKAFKTDADGRFDLPGTLTREHGGPVRKDETPDSRPVRFAGRVQNGLMSLTVTFTDNNESVGSYTLNRGKQGRLRKCL